MQTVASILWRKLDTAGHDACRLEQGADAWQIDGSAVFALPEGRIAQLHYRVRCDLAWRTRWGTVRGWIGGESIDLSITRDARGGWKLDDAAVADLGHCTDLDLGFTPATNLIVLRRLHLGVGETADAPAAWLDLESRTLGELAQRYERRGDAAYGYSAARFDYDAVLSVTPEAFVSDYPGLWRAES